MYRSRLNIVIYRTIQIFLNHISDFSIHFARTVCHIFVLITVLVSSLIHNLRCNRGGRNKKKGI